MQPWFWYLLLALFGGLIFGYTLWRKRDSKLIPLYTFMGGITYLFEYIVLVLFKSYIYYPHILKEPYFDNIMGAVFSDALVVPATAMFVVAFNLSFWQILIPVGLIIGIEVLFEYLGIYKHFWWEFYYTFGGLLVAFYIAKRWHRLLKKPSSLYVHFATLYFTNLFLQASTVFFLAGVFGKFFYSVGWFLDPLRSSVAFSTLCILLLSFIFVSLVVFSLNWLWVIGGIGLMSLMNIVLFKLNILQLSESWSLGYFVILYFLIYIVLRGFNRLFLNTGS